MCLGEEGPELLRSFREFLCRDQELLHRVGLDQLNRDLGLIGIVADAEPGHAGVAGVVELSQADKQFGLL